MKLKSRINMIRNDLKLNSFEHNEKQEIFMQGKKESFEKIVNFIEKKLREEKSYEWIIKELLK